MNSLDKVRALAWFAIALFIISISLISIGFVIYWAGGYVTHS